MPGGGHEGPDIKAWHVIAKAPREDVLVRVKLVMVVPKVGADLVARVAMAQRATLKLIMLSGKSQFAISVGFRLPGMNPTNATGALRVFHD